ncbi:class I SAM-dependent methyltransferase [Marinobacter sp.]|uniref:class I SAM-dependent methyltransferase n=1 Tax=Marinobacter sp. TaxID=50741 RepID=UPI00356A4E91
MNLKSENTCSVRKEAELYEKLLPLEGASIIELGCGPAILTRSIAENYAPESILACEVDSVQHKKNLSVTDLTNVRFVEAGAQSIPAPDASADIVLMFKSLHHVPLDELGTALREIKRVLRSGGLAYISEPIYAGNFNEVLRIFHDEKEVREAAFLAVRKAVESGMFELVGQHFFELPRVFRSCSEFESKMINVTHTNHQLSSETLAAVREQYNVYADDSGKAVLKSPMRVDLLRKP